MYRKKKGYNLSYCSNCSKRLLSFCDQQQISTLAADGEPSLSFTVVSSCSGPTTARCSVLTHVEQNLTVNGPLYNYTDRFCVNHKFAAINHVEDVPAPVALQHRAFTQDLLCKVTDYS